ncbi:Scr1 family TA system antitoxin-like transcriptional regulator [Glycomyces artemisiae]|uniref:HTH cro/C1-type domain-containing protein n=1 Tax=Glycomyces artemisiae TaxID=1076443 RepID=A0A2T0UAS3_9ACTN|nr:Scr1 family TA system antitoxin-like transcriptional regulator [Glycomyces artemisiae]PRY55004.1 hypothetical protein B0I28_113114 [Glycomyces artemisiae]
MAGTVLNQRLARSYLFAEVNTIAEAAGWTPNQFAKVMGKSGNTIRAWLDRTRLPDLGNLSLICDRGGVDDDRKQFILHVGQQLLSGSELISNLDQRNIFLVESAERTYGTIAKWNPVLLPGLAQTETVHMKLMLGPMEAPAEKIVTWKRKERRAAAFFARMTQPDPPTAELFVPASALRDLDLLTSTEKAEQVERLLWIDSLPTCEVLVVSPPHLAAYSFEMFIGRGLPSAGPNFVHVETLDQSRHVVDPEILALYDQTRSLLRADAQGIGRFLDGGVHQLAEEQPE